MLFALVAWLGGILFFGAVVFPHETPGINDTEQQENQKRRNQRPEAAHADRIPGPGAHRAQIGLPRLDVSDQPGLEIDLMDPPVALDVDSHRPGRQPPDLIRKPVKLVGELGRICQSQHDGLARLIPARLIQAGRPAARRRRQHQPGQQGNRPVKARQLIAPAGCLARVSGGGKYLGPSLHSA